MDMFRLKSSISKNFRYFLNWLFYQSANCYRFCDKHHLIVFMPIFKVVAKTVERIDLRFDGLTPEFINELAYAIIEEANKEN